MSRSKKDDQQILERRWRISNLRLAGIRDQRRIAKELEVSVGTVNSDFKALDAWYRDRAAANIQEEKGLDLDRIEALIGALWPDARKGKWLAIDRVVNLLARKARMLGYDSPEQVEHTINEPIVRVTILDSSDTDRPAPDSLAALWGGGPPLQAD